MYLIPRFIATNGLSVFVLDDINDDIVIDLGALGHLLERTNELRSLTIRNTKFIDDESLNKLITMVSDLINSKPPRLA